MPPFSISLRSGVPIYEQVIYAVTRAIVNGELQPGDPFPSVRALEPGSEDQSQHVAQDRGGAHRARTCSTCARASAQSSRPPGRRRHPTGEACSTTKRSVSSSKRGAAGLSLQEVHRVDSRALDAERPPGWGNAMTAVIETVDLTRRFGRLDAVEGLNLQVPAGSLFAFVGPNGAGKTTTIKVLLNLLRPTSGKAIVLGTDSRRIGPRELARIGYVSGKSGSARLDDGRAAHCVTCVPSIRRGMRSCAGSFSGISI